MKTVIKGDELVITLPLKKNPSPSASGKTFVVASSHGNQTTDAKVGGKSVVVSVNAFFYPEAKAA